MQLVKRVLLLISFSLFIMVSGCKKAEPIVNSSVVIAVSSDIERINPLYSFSVNEANINELLFLSLVKHNWDEKTGSLLTEPMIAKSWAWSKDSTSIIIDLRDDLKWSDGEKISAEDVVFSFDVYSDPAVQSYLYGTFKNFYADKENHVLADKTFEMISPYELKINFLPKSFPTLYSLDFPLIPKHIFEKIERKNIINDDINFKPVTSGPFTLDKWEKKQVIVLKKNKTGYLTGEGNVLQLIFKIIPEYSTRLAQLKKGEVDLVEDLKAEDVKEIKQNEKLNIVPVKGREYDYVGWNNIDKELYANRKKIAPNYLFGSANVRKALTLAINRVEVLNEFLGEYGSLANSPISPIFKNSVSDNLKPYPFDLEQAKQLLAEDGWKDTDGDGILEKNGHKFRFTLSTSSSKPRRAFTAALMKNTFKQIGIEFNIEQLEPGDFIDRLTKKNFDAWLAGWSIQIPLDLKISWFSNLSTTPLNFCSYQNKNVDILLNEIEKTNLPDEKNKLYKNLEEILYKEQPVTFLYWIDNIVAYNKRIRDIDVNPLGVIHYCWKWSVK